MSATTICNHFGTCGGCEFQHLTADNYDRLKRSFVVAALAKCGLENASVAPIVDIGPATRRRASFKAAKTADVTQLGFHAALSHRIVDMRECLVLTPTLFALVPRLRDMMHGLLEEGEKAELFVTEADNGFDVALKWKRKVDVATVAETSRWGKRLGLLRITANREILFEDEMPVVALGPARVALPAEVFLQPTKSGEAFLQTYVCDAAKGVERIADLFSGCGTFALPLARTARVHAAEWDKEALKALVLGARQTTGLKPLTAERRDLLKRPLSVSELQSFDAVVLDPPRAGAVAQVRELVRSDVRRVVYASCNPESFARDAKILTQNYAMGTVVPVDQFLWSSHIELATTFVRA